MPSFYFCLGFPVLDFLSWISFFRFPGSDLRPDPALKPSLCRLGRLGTVYNGFGWAPGSGLSGAGLAGTGLAGPGRVSPGPAWSPGTFFCAPASITGELGADATLGDGSVAAGAALTRSAAAGPAFAPGVFSAGPALGSGFWADGSAWELVCLLPDRLSVPPSAPASWPAFSPLD